jgi:hypothetical protein
MQFICVNLREKIFNISARICEKFFYRKVRKGRIAKRAKMEMKMYLRKSVGNISRRDAKGAEDGES